MSGGFKIELDGPDAAVFDEIARAGPEAARRTAELLAKEALEAVRKGAPVDKGNLRDRWHIEPSGELAYRLVNSAEYAEAVSKGTKPHTIMPRGRVLAFRVGGDMVFAAFVDHPGTTANPYVEDALDGVGSRIEPGVQSILARSLGF